MDSLAPDRMPNSVTVKVFTDQLFSNIILMATNEILKTKSTQERNQEQHPLSFRAEYLLIKVDQSKTGPDLRPQTELFKGFW